jgi:hypothetical protein
MHTHKEASKETKKTKWKGYYKKDTDIFELFVSLSRAK